MIPTNLPPFDGPIGGLEPGSVYIIAGRDFREAEMFAAALCESIGRRALLVSREAALPGRDEYADSVDDEGPDDEYFLRPVLRNLVGAWAGTDDMLGFIDADLSFDRQSESDYRYDVVALSDFEPTVNYGGSFAPGKTAKRLSRAYLRLCELAGRHSCCFITVCSLLGDWGVPKKEELYCAETQLEKCRGIFLLSGKAGEQLSHGRTEVRYQDLCGDKVAEFFMERTERPRRTAVSWLVLR